jgi:16S rRNA processing protein RimM
MARLAIGRAAGAAGAFGEAGLLRVQWLGDGPDGLLRATTVWLAQGEDDVFPRRHGVDGVAAAGRGEVVMRLAGLRDRDAAEAYKGRLVLVEEGELEPLGEDEYYWHELVGFDVVSQAGDAIGRVAELWETGAHDVLVVTGPGGERLLIPTAREILTEIDRDARRLVIAVIPGLLEPQPG